MCNAWKAVAIFGIAAAIFFCGCSDGARPFGEDGGVDLMRDGVATRGDSDTGGGVEVGGMDGGFDAQTDVQVEPEAGQDAQVDAQDAQPDADGRCPVKPDPCVWRVVDGGYTCCIGP